MAKSQTRRTVSLARPLYDAATTVAAKRGIPLSQLVADGLRAVGVNVETSHRPLADAEKATNARVASSAFSSLDELAAAKTAPPVTVDAKWCATCLLVRPPYTLEDGRAMCGVCSGEHPRSGRYSFASSRGNATTNTASVVGDGNRSTTGRRA